MVGAQVGSLTCLGVWPKIEKKKKKRQLDWSSGCEMINFGGTQVPLDVRVGL